MFRFAAVAFLWLSLFSAIEAMARNLLVNPDFESGAIISIASDGNSEGWGYTASKETYIRPEAGAALLYGPTGIVDTHSGKNAVFIGSLRDGVATIYQETEVFPNNLYRASVWVKTYDADGQGFGYSPKDSAGFILTELDQGGQVVAVHPKVEAVCNIKDWQFVSCIFKTDAKTVRVRFTLATIISCNHWHGHVKYDSCVLQPISDDITVAARKGPAVTIQMHSNNPLMQKTAVWCREFLVDRGFAAELSEGLSIDTGQSPLWVLELKEDSAIAESMKIKTAYLDSARADAYILSVFVDKERPVVSIVGKDAHGIRAGVARLVAIINCVDDRLLAAPTLECSSSFYSIRRLLVAPTGRIAQGGPWADTLWTNWSDERICRYAEQLWLFGFNSIEFAEIRGYRGVWSDEHLGTVITPKIRTFMKSVKDHGMQTSLFIWGQSLYVEGQNFCWNDQKGVEMGREKMKKEYVRLAQTYGDLTDHIIVHVGDPGGCECGVCDPYKTPQELTVFLHNEFKKINPHVTATLSTWANFGFWKGREGSTFLDETYSPKEIAVALHRWYDRDKAAEVVKSGRICSIWGWYISDYEMNLDMMLSMRIIDKYYSALPKQASKEIQAMSTGQCFMGWPQDINFYVTAQKMRSPYRPLREIEREYCAGIFGPSNADVMLAVYQTCEEFVHPDRYASFRPETDCFTDVFGTPAYNQRVQNALNAAKTVLLDMKYPTLFTSATSPKSHFDYLMRNLSLIQIFSNAAEKIDVEKNKKASKEKLQVIFDTAVTEADIYKKDPDYESLKERLKKSIEN